ncbi:MAG: hypothetical protein A3H49_10895 [Nitrospirae bacterium RIFCSPLOWO2_02_FULL_62_14]|nr:MAG: hypothetical protein A3H49_10895 [Nitrospirae bacterium RIFCSPLOWO2_02_FULL_62_14]
METGRRSIPCYDAGSVDPIVNSHLGEDVMPQVPGRLIACLALIAALLADPHTGLSASPGTIEDDPLVECTKKMEKMFSYVTIQVQELALDRLRVKILQQFIVIIPLKEPRGGIQAVQWAAKEPGQAMEFVRYLRAGKIGAVNVWPFMHNPGELYVSKGVPLEVIKSCQKEQLQEAFGKCIECDIAEWLNVKP